MAPADATPLSGAPSLSRAAEIQHLVFDALELSITLADPGTATKLQVRFCAPAGFRALDEGDLLDFFPCCSSDRGWIFEIQSKGWLAQESQRQGFISKHRTDLREFFVAGVNFCVSVIALEAPTISIIPT